MLLVVNDGVSEKEHMYEALGAFSLEREIAFKNTDHFDHTNFVCISAHPVKDPEKDADRPNMAGVKIYLSIEEQYALDFLLNRTLTEILEETNQARFNNAFMSAKQDELEQQQKDAERRRQDSHIAFQ